MHRRSFRLAAAMLSPWFTVLSLTLESSEVIGLRVATLLIVNEKVGAVFETSARLITGATLVDVIERFREQVAANARRLSP
jgi:hypothetical protein